MSWLPLPTVVFLSSKVSLPCTSAASCTVTVDRVASLVPVCAMAPTEAASISAPSGNNALSEDIARVGVGTREAGELFERSTELRR
ncbi:hypothetical protein D3C87_1891740 [compost metagenome]